MNTQVIKNNNNDSKNLKPNGTYKKNTQSELTANLLGSELLLGVLLKSVSASFNSGQEGRVTAVVAKERYHKATKNQAKQKIEHSDRSHTSNTIIKVILDSGSEGDLMFHEKGMLMH